MRMDFPFFTCKVKCSAAVLEIANQQNAYSMIIAIKDIIKFYKTVKCKEKFYYKIFSFLILYNHKLMEIYNYYAIIKKEKTTFYRYLIHDFSFTIIES